MTLANFKSMVAAYVNRTTTELTVNSQDLLLQAMNDARRSAQRAHNFELNRTEDAYLSTSKTGANWLTGCKTTPGGATAVLMKRIDEVWHCNTTTAPYLRTLQVDFSYTGRYKRELSLAGGSDFNNATSQQTVQNKFAYATGPTLFVTAVNTATNFKLVGIKFLDDLADGADPDIFLTYFTDWLKFATIANLNLHLKDGERFPIDARVVEDLWKSVQVFDGSAANMGQSFDME